MNKKLFFGILLTAALILVSPLEVQRRYGFLRRRPLVGSLPQSDSAPTYSAPDASSERNRKKKRNL